MIWKSPFLIMFALYFCLLASVRSQSTIYWNSLYDPNCNACLQPGVACDKGSCIHPGPYSCHTQSPPLQKIDDPRLVDLIKSEQCQFLQLPNSRLTMTEEAREVVESCNFLSEMGGGKQLKYQNNRAVLPNMTLTQNEARFKEMAAEEKLRPSSAIWLAQYYDYGIGTNQNRKKATQLILESAKIGDPMAQYAVAFRYAYGIGVARNTELALKWLNKIINAKLNLPSKMDSPILNYLFPSYEAMQLKNYDFRKQTAYCAQLLLNRIKNNEEAATAVEASNESTPE